MTDLEREIYLKFKKPRQADLPTDEQVMGAIKATWMLVEDEVISMSRAAEICGIKLLAYRIIVKKNIEEKNE